ncbi:hypothetical protein [Amycolatopsis sp.]|uniref:hypothetical protein n=1 Tax=Amycolatopsis sp. TaxID=37632 RepID=UPI002BC16F27|nr:hypothetical protein [Amycolatopsis sp.]HVV10603.1 hypothetical protein [Amycolatopsis sp.]
MNKISALLVPAACALTLGACASQSPAPAPVAPQQAAALMAEPPARAVECGTVTGPGNVQVKVSVQQGDVDCASATTLMTRYFARLTAADLARTDGAGPVALDPWTCGSDPGQPLSATCSTEDSLEVTTRPA